MVGGPTVLIAIALSLLTRGKKGEIFGATAASVCLFHGQDTS
jgi:hypothetical protein